MKKTIQLMWGIIVALLSACNNPIIIPADMPVTLPPNQAFILHATLTTASSAASATPLMVATASATIPMPTATPTETPTRTPVPTRKSPYPVAQGTPLINMGFQTISMENAPELRPVFSALAASRRHAATSTNGQKLFMSTSDGTFLFNREGEILAHWQNIFTAAIPCESCISANSDGSRFAVITRKAGTWEAQVYDVQGDQATLFLALPVEPGFKGAHNEASIAISPNNTYLAFRAGASPLRVLNLQTSLQELEFNRTVNSISFTPDETNFVIHSGQELIFYNVNDWKSPASLLLPREQTPYAFSPGDSLLAIAMPTLLRVYSIENRKTLHEIKIPPSNASTRQWQIAFTDDETIAGYAVRWDTFKTNATIETGLWNIETGETLRFDTTTGNSPDALATLWGSALALPPAAQGNLELGSIAYNAFRFISDGMMLINSPHSACWLKMYTGEATCFKDPANILFASDANTFKEMRENMVTNLVEFRGGALNIQVGPYRVAAINRSGEWALIDNGSGTDLYTKGKKLPQESVKGTLQGFAENSNLIVFTALENENSFTITVVDKTTGNAIYQKKDNFLYKPVIMTADGTIYYTQNELERNQTVFNSIDPKTNKISEISRFPLPAEPMAMALSATTGLFAIGQKDGCVLFMTQDGDQGPSFQAATSSIVSLSFSPDGRFLAVASAEGVRIFSIFPANQ